MDTPEFELVRCVGGADTDRQVWLARRLSDGEELLAAADSGLGHYYGSGGGANARRSAADEKSRGVRLGRLLDVRNGQLRHALLALLNHPNLISLAGIMHQRDPTLVEKGDNGSFPNMMYFVWDNPDAGTLAANMAMYPRPPRKSRSKLFMPESLCWHVLRSLLRALAYLHDGQQYCIDKDADPDAPIKPKLTSTDRDWMPILHRDINAENIWLQHPRGRETYGSIKLGGLDMAAVTAHMVGSNEAGDVADGFAMAPPPSANGPPENLVDMRVKALDEKLMPKRKERPYLVRDELHAVGAIIFKMMTGFTPPPPGLCEYCDTYHLRSCGCREWCDRFGCECEYGGCEHAPLVPSCEPQEGSITSKAMKAADQQHVASCPLRGVCVYHVELGRTRYTSSLRTAVSEMLWRDPVLSGLSSSPHTPRVGSMLGLVESHYEKWKRHTVEGQMTVDTDEHMIRAWRQERRQEWEKKENVRERAERARREAEEVSVRMALERERDLADVKADAALREQHRTRWREWNQAENAEYDELKKQNGRTAQEEKWKEYMKQKAKRRRKRRRALRREAGEENVSAETTDAEHEERLDRMWSPSDDAYDAWNMGGWDAWLKHKYGEEEMENESGTKMKAWEWMKIRM